MRYLMMIFIGLLTMQSVWADVTLTIVDQDNKPVVDAVIILSDSPVTTPSTIAKMDQIKSEFVPRVLTIQRNQSVIFPNSDDFRHHVYSFSIPKAFEIKLYKGREIPPIKFDAPGVVVLGCNIHDSMIGYIIIADNNFSVKTDKNGQVKIPAKIGDDISLWSERLLDGVTEMQHFDITSDTAQTIKLDLLPAIETSEHEHHHHTSYSSN